MAGYIICVGREKPEIALVSQVDKKTGQPVGQDRWERVMTVGKHLLINHIRVWGRRLIKGKVHKTEKGDPIPVEFNTPGYTGEIEFLKWGTTGGHGIECRFLENSLSLDVEYQDNIQKVKIDKNQGPASIELESGENKFDPNKQALLISYLKVHPQNRDSVSKNPDPSIKGHMYFEVTDDTVDKTSIKRMESRVDAGYYVKSISTHPDKVRNLFEVMGNRPEFGDTNPLSNDTQVYKVLLRYAETNPGDFLSLIEEYKKELQRNFQYAESFNALDLTKNGVIVLTVSEKKEIIWDKVDAKGDQMKEWVIENYLDQEVYEKTKHFKALLKKVK